MLKTLQASLTIHLLQMVEKLRFGTNPETWEQAMVRLPEVLQETIKHSNNLYSLESRMIPITYDELKLIENVCFSFKRNLQLAFNSWSTLKPENPWSEIYGSGDDKYKLWKIDKMAPQPNSDFILICIETNSRFEEDSEFNIGLVTEEELQKLIISFYS